MVRVSSAHLTFTYGDCPAEKGGVCWPFEHKATNSRLVVLLDASNKTTALTSLSGLTKLFNDVEIKGELFNTFFKKFITGEEELRMTAWLRPDGGAFTCSFKAQINLDDYSVDVEAKRLYIDFFCNGEKFLQKTKPQAVLAIADAQK